MGSFSLFHWLIVLVVSFLWIFPIWMILQRIGRPGPLALVALIPLLGVVLLWWIALSRWPSQDSGSATNMLPRT
ncbi:hypothetical protein [Reyranella sp. CPCC 100927]|uniref:hypothetical protein n=1 Tax=Reyranella sp. CPCC 100927 TaxID=2599616 RepID=UPI0011B783F1|nr:hypothetical protein [Reyranella sp. CPCC 100927]TWT03913.1 hypothetical protein FQU96_28260 [Reyranella sp. CPCC 100927]